MSFDPGQFRERVQFEARAAGTDDYANESTGPFTARFVRSALFLMKPGSEAVLAARLAGLQPVSIVVSLDSETRTVTAAWQVRDLRTGTVYAVKGAADMERRGQWLTVTAESGIAS